MDRWIEDRYFQQVIRSNHNRSTQTKTPFEFKEYYLDEWANMNSPVQLAEKLEEFEDFKRTLKQKIEWSKRRTSLSTSRRLAFTERQEVNKQIEEWLNEGIIRPSTAEYASPIVMVKKKDGSSRMCIDYRKLNQKLVKDKFPLPIIEDVLDTLQEAKVYSTLDLRNGFFSRRC
ncbi:hypothetical protein TNCV_2293581 [Trichonephila clavipes]|nr:hypothetical protein TNCV_2293581 [Trichonephila clavipes]